MGDAILLVWSRGEAQSKIWWGGRVWERTATLFFVL